MKVTLEQGASLLKAQGGSISGDVTIVRKGEWKTIEADGWPEAPDGTMFFCWGRNWKGGNPEILEFWPAEAKPGFERAPCFGDDGGAWPDVTHYMQIQYPKAPVIETHSVVMTPMEG